ncbi:hypothetical protein HQ520_04785, partial [bacterium]|nr:hypothetical protein [bacterium]
MRSEEPRAFLVSDYGALGDGKTDDYGAIQRAIDTAIGTGGGRVVFEPGRVYRLDQRLEACGALLVEGATSLTLEGNGATLLAHPSNRILSLYNSRDIVVRDLILDYDPLPFTQARMVQVDTDAGVVRLEVCPGYADPVIGGEDLYGDNKHSDSVFIDGESRLFTQSWLRLREVQPAPEGGFTARFHWETKDVARQLGRTKAGDFIVIKMRYPQGEPKIDGNGRYIASSAGNVGIAFCKNVRLENVTSYAAPVMTFNSHGSEGVVLENCSVVRKAGTDRVIAGQSDAVHLKSLTIMPRLLGCRFEAVMDDLVHVKTSANTVQEVKGPRLRLTHADIAYNDVVLEPGQEVIVYDPGKKMHLGVAKIRETERTKYREMWVTLDSPIQGVSQGTLVFPKPQTTTEIRGCE